nr:hypothetical protein BHM03_00029805 [Ipomoea batatas]GME19393.1 hypothetical protein BHM03_00029805 [Ipomoea batatas]
MGFQVALDSVHFVTFVTLECPFSVFPAEVFSDAGEVSECFRRVVIRARCLRANVYSLLNHLIRSPLLQLPRHVVAAAVELQILLPLEPFATHVAHVSPSAHSPDEQTLLQKKQLELRTEGVYMSAMLISEIAVR